MTDFNFKGSEVNVENKGNNTGVSYVKPGIHELCYNSITFKTSQNKGTPYMDCVGTNKNGEQISRQYYLTTSKGPSGKSALDISTESLKKLSIAIGKEKEYDSVSASSPEEFVYKMSAIFTGQWFRTKVKGKEIMKNDGSSFIKGEISDAFESVSIPSSSSRLKFDESKDIKYLEKSTIDSTDMSSEATNDLPF